MPRLPPPRRRRRSSVRFTRLRRRRYDKSRLLSLSLPFLALRPYPANLMRFTRNRQFSLKCLRKVGSLLCRAALGLSNLTLNYAIHFAQLSSCSFGFPVPTLSSSLDPLIPISCFSHKTEPSLLCHASLLRFPPILLPPPARVRQEWHLLKVRLNCTKLRAPSGPWMWWR